LFGNYELPYLRQETPPLSPTASARPEEELRSSISTGATFPAADNLPKEATE